MTFSELHKKITSYIKPVKIKITKKQAKKYLGEAYKKMNEDNEKLNRYNQEQHDKIMFN